MSVVGTLRQILVKQVDWWKKLNSQQKVCQYLDLLSGKYYREDMQAGHRYYNLVEVIDAF